ncbi:MAG: hypothetical protein QOF80_1003 [Verrucomicrobiota bacterium]|jgi:hypothetical protein
MTMAAPPLNERFPAKRDRQPSDSAAWTRVVSTEEARASLSKHPHPSTHVAG